MLYFDTAVDPQRTHRRRARHHPTAAAPPLRLASGFVATAAAVAAKPPASAAGAVGVVRSSRSRAFAAPSLAPSFDSDVPQWVRRSVEAAVAKALASEDADGVSSEDALRRGDGDGDGGSGRLVEAACRAVGAALANRGGWEVLSARSQPCERTLFHGGVDFLVVARETTAAAAAAAAAGAPSSPPAYVVIPNMLAHWRVRDATPRYTAFLTGGLLGGRHFAGSRRQLDGFLERLEGLLREDVFEDVPPWRCARAWKEAVSGVHRRRAAAVCDADRGSSSSSEGSACSGGSNVVSWPGHRVG